MRRGMRKPVGCWRLSVADETPFDGWQLRWTVSPGYSERMRAWIWHGDTFIGLCTMERADAEEFRLMLQIGEDGWDACN
jgi:hypothetical protein